MDRKFYSKRQEIQTHKFTYIPVKQTYIIKRNLLCSDGVYNGTMWLKMNWQVTVFAYTWRFFTSNIPSPYATCKICFSSEEMYRAYLLQESEKVLNLKKTHVINKHTSMYHRWYKCTKRNMCNTKLRSVNCLKYLYLYIVIFVPCSWLTILHCTWGGPETIYPDRIFVVFRNLSRNNLGQYLNIHHNLSQLITHKLHSSESSVK